MPRTPTLALACLLTACSDPIEPAELLEHCGASTPVRVQGTPPGQLLGFQTTIGDRVYRLVGRPELDPLASNLVPRDRSLWSSGPCGEAPARLTDDPGAFPFTIQRWPDLPLACLADGVAVLDPLGARPPHLLFPIPDCSSITWTERGLIHRVPHDDDDFVEIQLIPYPDDPHGTAPAPIVLADSVQRHESQLSADAIHVVTDDATLVRIDLADGDTTPIQANVSAFQFSDDGRWLVWRDASTPVVSLRDTTSGTGVALGTSKFFAYDLNLAYIDRGVLVFGSQLFLLPSFTVLNLPADTRVIHVDPARGFALIAKDHGRPPWLRRIDLADGTLTTFFHDFARIVGLDDDGLLILAAECCREKTAIPEGPVLQVPYDGGPPRRLADRATRIFKRLDATTLVTLVDLENDLVGTLVHIDTTTRSERRIDTHVTVAYDRIPTGPDPGVITYSVDDGDRSGVHTARLATTP